MSDEVEKISVEFTVPLGKRDAFLAALEAWDKKTETGFDFGYRADDYVQRRRALSLFVDQMELKLRANDHKTTWREKPIEALFRLMLLEIEEFKVAHEFFTISESRPELVDVANFCVILWDRLGMLDQKRPANAQSDGIVA